MTAGCRAAARGAFLTVGWLLAAGCSVYDQSLLGEGSGGTSSGGAGGAAMTECRGGECWWSGQNEDGCRTAGVPSGAQRPDPGSVSQDDVPPIYLGVYRLWIGASDLDGNPTEDAWQGFGMDIDGICTNSMTCANAGSPVACLSAGAMIPFDGNLCRDNTFARLQPTVAAVPCIPQALGISEDLTNCNLWNGNFTIVVKVSRYNGTPNDDSIRVDYYVSPGLQLPPGWECPRDDFRQFPRWLASTPWTIADRELTGPIVSPGELPDSIQFDETGYVRDGYLVAGIPNGANLDLAGENGVGLFPGFDLRIFGGFISARLEQQQDGTWSGLDGIVAGKVRGDDLKQSFRNIGFCDNHPLFPLLDVFVTENTDTLSMGENNPTAMCDAMSLGLAFEAAQLTPGPAVNRPPRPPCDPMFLELSCADSM